jgi:hypothetical protein
MYALSVMQPEATLLVLGARRLEVRSWHTARRGRLAIHASLALPPDADARCTAPEARGALRAAGVLDLAHLPRGAVVGTVELLDCVGVEELSEPERALVAGRPGQWAFLFARPRLWPRPVRARGRLGVFPLRVPVPEWEEAA